VFTGDTWYFSRYVKFGTGAKFFSFVIKYRNTNIYLHVLFYNKNHWGTAAEIKDYCEVVKGKGKCKAIPVQPWTGPEVSRRLKLLDFKTIGT
jgi:hypothetical protein